MNEKRVRFHRIHLMIFTLLVACWVVVPTRSEAQSGSAGQNAICTLGTGCSAGSGTMGSSAFIDAAAFGNSITNLCSVLNFILNPTSGIIPVAGAVIDARGLPGKTGTSMTCAASPWAGITNPPPSTILLPAAVITIPGIWILPNGTQLIGENNRLPQVVNSGQPNATTLLACTTSICTSGNFSDSAMLQFGDNSHCPSAVCRGISVDGVALNGNGLTIAGITNANAQERSYVDHVTLYQILGVGLQIAAGADNSGPYSNITFDTGIFSPSFTSTACAKINGTAGTRGIHSFSCIGESTNGSVGIYLDASNNSLDDIRIMGFDDEGLVATLASSYRANPI